MGSWRYWAWATILTGCSGGEASSSAGEDASTAAEVGTTQPAGDTWQAGGTMQELFQTESTASADEGTAEDEAPTAGGSSGSSGSSEGESSSESGSEPETTDFFACGFTSQCDPVTYDRVPEPSEAARCIAERAASGRAALVRWIAIPSITSSTRELDSWIVLLGDGTAVVQSRALLCLEDYAATGDEECDVDLVWSRSQDPVRCDVHVDPEACPDSCPEGEDCGCTWNPSDGMGLANCLSERATWTCDAVEQAIAD